MRVLVPGSPSEEEIQSLRGDGGEKEPWGGGGGGGGEVKGGRGAGCNDDDGRREREREREREKRVSPLCQESRAAVP